MVPQGDTRSRDQDDPIAIVPQLVWIPVMYARLLGIAPVSLLAFLVASVAIAADDSVRPAGAPQQPVAVVAVAGIDQLLTDVDFLFAAGEAPQHAQMIRGVIANLNELRGLDRSRPVGMLLYFPSVGESDPQPLVFFPVSDVEELMTSVRIGNALYLERTDKENRLTFHTEDGPIPVELQHGYAYFDPGKTGKRLDNLLVNPDDLLGDALANHDAALLVRREGIPPFLFEVAIGQLRSEALKQQNQNEDVSDADYAVRREIEQSIFSLLEAAVRDWRGVRIGLRLSEEDRIAQLDLQVTLDSEGTTASFLQQIRGEGSRFPAQLAEASALSVSANWKPTPHGRDLLARITSALRDDVEREVADADATSREAVTGVIDAIEATAAQGAWDSYIQFVGAPPNGFVLIGAIAIQDASKVAVGIERLLPFAAESKDIREIEMNVGRAGDVAIHRMLPQKLRKQDRRLYGDDAAIYLAAGNDALWLAVGGEGTLELLADSIQLDPSEAGASAVVASPRSLKSAGTPLPTGPRLFDLTLHASDWVGFARTDGGGRNARIAQLARKAFENPEQDSLRLMAIPTDDGLQLTLRLDHGYIRLIGLALAEAINKGRQ